MKTTLTLISIICFQVCFSQDTLKIKQIDKLVSDINMSLMPIQRDTIIQDYPEMGLKMVTYLSMVTNDGELIKYENLVKTTRKENTETRQMTTSNAFYYNRNKLIKVEEYLIEAADKKTMDWYYSDDKALYYTLKSNKAADRAASLLKIAKEMVKKMTK